MTSNRAADQIQQEPGSGSPKVSIGSAVGGHDHLKDAPQDSTSPARLHSVMTVWDVVGPFLRDGRPAAGAD